jgi:hypothetical protein
MTVLRLKELAEVERREEMATKTSSQEEGVAGKVRNVEGILYPAFLPQFSPLSFPAALSSWDDVCRRGERGTEIEIGRIQHAPHESFGFVPEGS